MLISAKSDFEAQAILILFILFPRGISLDYIHIYAEHMKARTKNGHRFVNSTGKN